LGAAEAARKNSTSTRMVQDTPHGRRRATELPLASFVVAVIRATLFLPCQETFGISRGYGTFARLPAAGINSSSMRRKLTLPLLLLLLVAGQLSAELCMAQCQSTRITEPACAMHAMAHGHCASCKHAFANGTNASFSTMGTCSDQTCSSVLDLAQSRPDNIRPVVSARSFDILRAPVLEDTHSVRSRDARSTRSISPFDPLISSLRI